tara:strand:+ start:365 stop:676 length:312 start_codon:yes stop_codon:yes gene_type:complete
LLKYRNKKTEVDGIIFDSKAEAKRYTELKLLEKANAISDLRLQPKFDCVINGKKICSYRADFDYYEYDKYVCEDVKGFKTPVYRLKKKLVEALHNVKIVEVRR